jgi:hypothetical protein
MLRIERLAFVAAMNDEAKQVAPTIKHSSEWGTRAAAAADAAARRVF